MSKKEYTSVRSRADGLELSVLVLVPELTQGERLRGVVQLLHGMCEYKERYLPLMEFLNRNGFACVIHDHRGHGKSIRNSDDIGYMYAAGADGFVDDILQVNQFARERFSGVPLILFGHSMGSLAARSFTRQYDDCMDALILSGSPSRDNGRMAGTVLAMLQKKMRGGRSKGKLLEALSFGRYAAQHPESRRAWVCSDLEVVRACESDPLCAFTFTVDAYLVLFELMRRTYDKRGWKCSKPTLPILFLGGSDDPCIGGEKRFEQSMDHLRAVGYLDVQGKLYPKMRHEICNETGKEQVYQEMVDFLTEKGF